MIVHIEETDSFGRRLSHHKLANVAMLSFGGGQLDEDTGLVHFLFRDYDPATGFFIQQDPLGLRGGDVDVYGYCLDDPMNLVDPLGLKTTGIGVSGSASGFGVGAGAGAMLVWDDNGKIGIEYYGDTGAASGYGLSASGAVQKTTADSIEHLKGSSDKAGVNINIPFTPIMLGKEGVKGDGYTGESYSIGAGTSKLFIPIDAYAKKEVSGVTVLKKGDEQRK